MAHTEDTVEDSARPQARSTPRTTKRRIATRQRLLDAAFEVFAEIGFGRSTVEQICERAGYTRGAFYSNFGSLDELFLAMWEQRSGRMLEDMSRVLESLRTRRIADFEEIGGRLIDAVPVDAGWYGITAEFTAHALRNPALRGVMARREAAIMATIMPIVEALLEQSGRVVTDRTALGQALIAVHDGTSVQVLLEPEVAAVRERRVELFRRVVLAYTVPKRE